MTQISHSEKETLYKIITNLAHKAVRNYPSRYQDLDDYIQIGYIALYKARQTWCSSGNNKFIAYALKTIDRAIRKSAIQSTCFVSASYAMKTLASKIRAKLAMGYNELEICTMFDINNQQWHTIKALLQSHAVQIDVEDSGNVSHFIQDISHSKFLTDKEQSIIFERLNGKTKIDNVNVHRQIKTIKNKLTQSGYDNGS